MKNFLNNIFKPYIFPIIILVIGAFLKTGENLTSVTSFFSDSSFKFLNFFNHEFYLWEVLLYLVIVFTVIKVYRLIFKAKTKKEKKMLAAIKRVPTDFPVNINNSSDKFIFKYEPSVLDEEYKIKKLRPYCINCTPKPIRMSEYGFGDFRCNCGKKIGYRICQDIKNRIITVLEENE